MLPAIYSFKKSFEQRLKEYKHLCSSQEPCCKIFQVWAFDLECVIDKMDWQALWQLSEETCSQYNALFPTTVVVKVTEIIFEELTASVVVEGVQDDLSFPDVVYVPLFELFPVQVPGPYSELVYFRNIADWLDRCRFFCLYLWYYWDGTNSTKLISEWAEEHLHNRLRLQYDIRDGTLDKSIASYIQCLLTEAVQVADAIANSEDSEPSNEVKLAVLKNHVRQENIKIELQLFEVPDLRNAMVTYINEKKNVSSNKTIVTVLMPSSVKIGEAAQFFNRIQSFVKADSSLRILNDAICAFASVSSLCTVLIAPGIYCLENLGGLSYGGTIKGIGAGPEETILVPASAEPKKFMFLSCFNSVNFENITVNRSEGVQVCAFEGIVRFESCHFTGEPGCLARGIVVQPGCRVEMINCVLSNLSTAIIAKNKSSICLTSTVIQNCAEGIKFMDEVSVDLSGAIVKNCSVAGLVLVTSLPRSDITGSIDIFKDCITVNSYSFVGNKVDAMVELLPQEIIIENGLKQ